MTTSGGGIFRSPRRVGRELAAELARLERLIAAARTRRLVEVTRMNPRLLALLTTVARGVVRLVLVAHPRPLQRRFGGDILNDVADDIRMAAAGSGGSLAAVRAAARALVDAVAGLGTPRGTAANLLHFRRRKMSIRSWLRDAATDVRLSIRGFTRERVFTASVVRTLALWHRRERRDVRRRGSTARARSRARARR